MRGTVAERGAEGAERVRVKPRSTRGFYRRKQREQTTETQRTRRKGRNIESRRIEISNPPVRKPFSFRSLCPLAVCGERASFASFPSAELISWCSRWLCGAFDTYLPGLVGSSRGFIIRDSASGGKDGAFYTEVTLNSSLLGGWLWRAVLKLVHWKQTSKPIQPLMNRLV